MKDKKAEELRHRTVERQLPTVYRICVNRLSGFDSSRIEDVCQEVFVRWLSTAPAFRNAEHERAWFISVTLNLCTDVMREHSRHPTGSLEECGWMIGDPDADGVLGEREIIRQMLTLPEAYRDVLYLYFVEGYTTPEIAKILNKKANTVRRELARGREMLKKLLKGNDER